MGNELWLAAIGTLGPLAAAGVLLASHIWARSKTLAEAAKSNADAELVTANMLTVVIDGLKAELARVNLRVDGIDADLEEERTARRAAQDLERAARMELAETEHRFSVLVDHHGDVATLAYSAGLVLPQPPALLLPYLGAYPMRPGE